MSFNRELHIVFQVFCLVFAIHFITLNTGGVDYLSVLSSKEKALRFQDKDDLEKKVSSNSTDETPEAEDLDNFGVVFLMVNNPYWGKCFIKDESEYHSALTLFSTYTSNLLRGHRTVIIKPPEV